jgi:hypothetical protein
LHGDVELVASNSLNELQVVVLTRLCWRLPSTMWRPVGAAVALPPPALLCWRCVSVGLELVHAARGRLRGAARRR